MKQGFNPRCPDCGAPVKFEAGHRKMRCPHCDSPLVYDLGLRGRAALMLLRCPGCGASTEHPEDALTVVCAYCQRKLIVTGEGRALRFFIPPRVDRAAAEAKLGRPSNNKSWVFDEAFIVFVPYWRFRGMVYTWETGINRAINRDSLFGAFGNIRLRRIQAHDQDQSAQAGSFGFGHAGLGIRLKVINQNAYDPEGMAKYGKTLEPTMARVEAAEILTRGAEGFDVNPDLAHHMQYGSIVGGRLSMVWYPYWIFPNPSGPRRFIVDAVSGEPLPEAKPAASKPPVAISAEAPSLIAAECPACGTDFPAEGFEKLFFCSHCQKAWRPEGRTLVLQPYQLVSAGNKVKCDSHFPVWRLKVSIKSGNKVFKDQAIFRELVPGWSYSGVNQDAKKPIYLYVPAWGNRITPKFSIIAKRYTREQPDLLSDKAPFGGVIRAIFGPKEAAQLALLNLLGVIHMNRHLAKLVLGAQLRVEAQALYLLPFRKGDHEWHDALTGTAIPLAEVGERRF